MGLMQKACETYDANRSRVGQVTETQGTLCPVGHILQKARVEILLDADGVFLSAQEVSKEDSQTIIPATEKSATRSSTQPAAHPFSDQLQYLSGDMDAARHARYLGEMEKWLAFDPHPDLQAVHNYILRGTILRDLERVGLYTAKKKIQNLGAAQWLVRWIVDGRQAWRNLSLFHSFCGYLASQAQGKRVLCMISGEEGELCSKHDKGIVGAYNEAKLISSNDLSNFTYRGRFTEAEQACTISFEASQKAHRALQWIVETQGKDIDGRTFVCWNPQGKRVVLPCLEDERDSGYTVPTAYYKALDDTLGGYRNALPKNACIVTAAFDAATKGRLALTYYSELTANDFYDRIENWYKSCCWPFEESDIKSPPLKQIADYAFGREQKKRIKTPQKVICGTVQRLLACLLNQARIPEDIVKQLFHNAANPLRYSERSNRIKVLCTACAVIRKYRNDQSKKEEEWTMSLDIWKEDRSYQFGRLLAVMEYVERSTYSKDEDREPNAIRLQSAFNERPFHTSKVIEGQLNPYFARLKPGMRSYCKGKIEQILGVISNLTISGRPLSSEELNRPLEDTYLMGYYLQRADLYTKKEKDENETEDNEQ